jgi:hypothetical protein
MIEKEEDRSVRFTPRREVLSGEADQQPKKPEKKMIECNMMMVSQTGPMWLRNEK